jgi:hypothetical protein
MELDESFVPDLSGHETDELEVVTEGVSSDDPALLAAVDELTVGAWYLLEYRDRHEPVQLAWQGLRKHLCLFVTAQGRCVLFQRGRLAAFLQAGLMAPVRDETLTTAATRDALARINADPSRLR